MGHREGNVDAGCRHSSMGVVGREVERRTFG